MPSHQHSKRKTHVCTERPPFERIALILQGGGALGAYQKRFARDAGSVPATTIRLVPRSRFEIMAGLAHERSARSEDWLYTILDAVNSAKHAGGSVLQPLWAEEALHRAYGLMRLAARTRHHRPRLSNALDRALAQHLAERFRALDRGEAREIVPCAAPLRDVSADLCALFGSQGDIDLRTKIERVALPMYKRRALVLAAAELVMNALLHAFTRRASGLIAVHLTAFGPRHAHLLVRDNGGGFLTAAPNLRIGVAATLADVLEAELVYERTNSWTTAQILFPVRV